MEVNFEETVKKGDRSCRNGKDMRESKARSPIFFYKSLGIIWLFIVFLTTCFQSPLLSFFTYFIIIGFSLGFHSWTFCFYIHSLATSLSHESEDHMDTDESQIWSTELSTCPGKISQYFADIFTSGAPNTTYFQIFIFFCHCR